MKTVALVTAALAALVLSGCAKPETEAPATASAASGATAASGSAIKRYDMHGKIVTVDTATKVARIDAGPIGDWMGAMTMNYTIKDDAGLAKLKPGSVIDATVYVQGDDFWVGEIKTQ